jgi:type II restriction enzyme
MINTNIQHYSELSSDMGAIASLLFEIGTQKLILGSDVYLFEPERK